MSSSAQQYVKVFACRKRNIWKTLWVRRNFFLLEERLHGFPPRPIISELDEDQWTRYGNIRYSRRRKAHLHRSVEQDELHYARRLA